MARIKELKKITIRIKFRNKTESTNWRTFLLNLKNKLNASVHEAELKQQQQISFRLVVWLASLQLIEFDCFILKTFCKTLPIELRKVSQLPVLFSGDCPNEELLFLLFSSLIFENCTDMTAIKMLRNQKDPILINYLDLFNH